MYKILSCSNLFFIIAVGIIPGENVSRPQWVTRHDGESLLGLGDRRKNAPGTVRFICSRQLPSWLYVVTLIHFSSSHHSKLHFPPQSSTEFEFIWRLHRCTNPIFNRVIHLCIKAVFSVSGFSFEKDIIIFYTLVRSFLGLSHLFEIFELKIIVAWVVPVVVFVVLGDVFVTFFFSSKWDTMWRYHDNYVKYHDNMISTMITMYVLFSFKP